MRRVTTHTHTELCGHAEGAVAELAAAARAAGISVLAITEHYPLSAAYDPECHVSMPASRMEEYVAAVRLEQEREGETEVLCGCELDWLGALEDRALCADDLACFDVVLGSVHYLDGWAFDDPAEQGSWRERGVDGIWRRYFEEWCACVSSDLPIHVMSHPDLVKKFGFYPSFDPLPLYRQAAEAARESGRMIEVNTAGAFYPCKEMYPAPELLSLFCQAGVPCTVGTDAHSPAHVARGIEDAYRLMYEAGYRELTVPARGGDRRTIPIV